MKQAETALQAAKQSGRDRVCRFNPADAWVKDVAD
jgi:PleD family two-component response regulator